MFILNQHNSIANQFLADLRDTNKQKDRLRFRKNLERLGEIMAYEISKDLVFKETEVKTPFKTTNINLLDQQPIIISILRASIPFYQGILNFFDEADSGFIGAFRQETDENDFHINLSYLATPSIEGKTLIVVDPMLATGKSFYKGIHHLHKNGTPEKIHIVSIIATPEGISFVKENLHASCKFWTCALDEKLNSKSYIIPGLGDAGDLAFGPKI